MQSFKQYLKESTYPSTPYIDISTGIFSSEIDDWKNEFYDGDGDLVQVFENWLNGNLQDHFEITNDEIKVHFDSGGELILTIDLPDTNADLSSSHIHNTSRKVLKVIDDLLDTKLENRNIDSIYLTFRQELEPNVKTDWPYIQFYLPHSNPISLENIHLKIPQCKALIFFHSIDKIESNVLGLLKIKTLNHITIWPSLSTNLEWYSILHKHFKSDKNILACQEELIDAGLKDYAEL